MAAGVLRGGGVGGVAGLVAQAVVVTWTVWERGG